MSADRVFIVEDDVEVAGLMRMILEDEGYQVQTHPDGDCIRALDSFQPDVILCDYMLPVRSGLDLLSILRESGLLRAQFVMISAVREATLDWDWWGVDDFLAKPFDVDHLVEVVDRASGRAAA